MTAVPGQRAVQQPLRAAMATQRAIGRALSTNLGAPVSARGVAMLDGAYFDVDLSGARSRMVPRGPVRATLRDAVDDSPPDTVRPGCPDSVRTVSVQVTASPPDRPDVGPDMSAPLSGQCPDSSDDHGGPDD